MHALHPDSMSPAVLRAYIWLCGDLTTHTPTEPTDPPLAILNQAALLIQVDDLLAARRYRHHFNDIAAANPHRHPRAVEVLAACRGYIPRRHVDSDPELRRLLALFIVTRDKLTAALLTNGLQPNPIINNANLVAGNPPHLAPPSSTFH